MCLIGQFDSGAAARRPLAARRPNARYAEHAGHGIAVEVALLDGVELGSGVSLQVAGVVHVGE